MTNVLINAGMMELAVADLIGYRQNTIVPNVSYGLYLNHECDLLVLDKKGRFTEVEIKISMSDLRADFKKGHGHKSGYISRLIYAVPDFMLDKSMEIIPKDCGVISVRYSEQLKVWRANWVRQVRHDKNKGLPSKEIIEKFYQLGCMRVWSLKFHNSYHKAKRK